MIEGLFTDSNYLAAKKMLDVTVLRQDAIASNLANIETPNYKRLDVSKSFEAQLKQAVTSRDPEQIASVQPQLAVDTQAQSSRSDGNTVQLETELLKMNQNMVEHALETQLVTNSFMRMRMAITGKS
ncbi:MAG TPA: flagellar basal body rod protein FlgB [Verrucomicrobiae bacterium]|jgi:flagellar basal-body rod protein FlgB|nr:flagellar basal body rod protein FlgB [Verrucomicrobiae bacterium]